MFCVTNSCGSPNKAAWPPTSNNMPTFIIPTRRSSTSFGGACSGAILSGESMDPLEKFKTNFVRARGEAYQPGEKPGEKPRPKRKASGQAPVKPTPAQSNLREFGDALPGDELDNVDTDFGRTNINPTAPQYSEINPPPADSEKRPPRGKFESLPLVFYRDLKEAK